MYKFTKLFLKGLDNPLSPFAGLKSILRITTSPLISSMLAETIGMRCLNSNSWRPLIAILNMSGSTRIKSWKAWPGTKGRNLCGSRSSSSQTPPLLEFLTTQCSSNRGLKWKAISLWLSVYAFRESPTTKLTWNLLQYVSQHFKYSHNLHTTSERSWVHVHRWKSEVLVSGHWEPDRSKESPDETKR